MDAPAKQPKYGPLVDDLCRRYDKLKSDRGPWDSLWQDIGDFIQPRKARFTNRDAPPNNDKEQRLFDSTAVQSNIILANGQLAWMTPHETPWFAFEPQRPITGSDRAQRWFQQCTEEIRFRLSQSNFYTEIHELYLDRGGFGTSAIYSEGDELGNLHFAGMELGTFTVAENHLGFVDTVFREQEMTLRAVAQKFGEDRMPDDWREKLNAGGSGVDEKVCVIHCIYPRADADRLPGKLDGENMPIASVYFEKRKKHVLRVSGYEEMPVMVTRFLKWGDAPYGWSPSWMALPDTKQLNFIQEMMDVLAEVNAFPRILAPASLESEIDTRANGVTYFDENAPNAVPKEWLTQGRYDIGKDRVLEKQKAIERAFHVDLFQMFAQLQKQMTAREVAERSAEKLTQFSPTFGRIVTELLGPLLQRVFGIMLRGGFLPTPPPEIIQPTGDGFGFIPPPNVVYSSRIALAIRSLHNVGFSRVMEQVLPLAQIRPDVLDHWNFDRIYRDVARNDGVPADWILPEEQVAKIREARAKQAEAQAQMELAERGAGAAVNAAKAREIIKPKAA